MKKALDEYNSRLNPEEKTINEHKDRTTKTIQTEAQAVGFGDGVGRLEKWIEP